MQLKVDLRAVALPPAVALETPREARETRGIGGLRELQHQLAQLELAAVARLPGHFGFQRGDRQSPLVPAAGRCIGQRDARTRRRIQAAAVDRGASRQGGLRQAAAQAGQVQCVQARVQRSKRPGRERLQARVGVQAGRRRALAPQLQLQLEVGQWAARPGAGLPSGLLRRVGQRARLGVELERERCVGGDLQAPLGLQPVPGERDVVEAVQRAGACAHLHLGTQVGQRGLPGQLEPCHAQVGQGQRDRQAQRRGRPWRRAGGRVRRAGRHDDPRRTRATQLQASPGRRHAGVRAPGPTRVVPGHVLDRHRAVPGLEDQPIRRERPAREAAAHAADLQPRQA